MSTENDKQQDRVEQARKEAENLKATASAQAAETAGQDVESLQKALFEAQEKVKDSTDKMMRAQAEAENARRRARLDVENAHKYGSEKFAKELLNVMDSLERGMEAAGGETENTQVKGLLEGVELTHKMLLDTFDKFGIATINPENQTFDPKCHEALSIQESADVPPNTVLAVLQQGFMIYDRVLRPARVVVSKAAVKAATAQQTAAYATNEQDNAKDSGDNVDTKA